jgi:hypothetical protein
VLWLLDGVDSSTAFVCVVFICYVVYNYGAERFCKPFANRNPKMA